MGLFLFDDNDSRAQLLNNAHGTNSYEIASELRILTPRYIGIKSFELRVCERVTVFMSRSNVLHFVYQPILYIYGIIIILRSVIINIDRARVPDHSHRREIVKEIVIHSGKWVRDVVRKWKRVEYAI